MKLKQKLIKQSVFFFLNISAWFARRTTLNPVTKRLMRSLAWLTIHTKNIQPQSDLTSLGTAWQKGFPSSKQVPITSIDQTTVLAEIHTPCPLRGSGDTHACYRMMEFDRSVVRRAGGEFVVLRSQAEPGVTVCQVALRMQGVNTDDLIPAHQRVQL